MNARRAAGFVLTLGGVGVLCTLGTWQVQRLAWKEDIVARIESARAAPQIFTYDGLQTLAQEDTPLAYGSVHGLLLTAHEVLVGPVTGDGGEIGYNLVTPVALDGGTILVHRGWMDEQTSKDISARAYTAPKSMTFTGIVRKPDYNRFSSGNNPAGDQWLRLDPAQIASAKNLERTLPLVMYADATSVPFPNITLNPPGWAPRNNHRQYAIFWYTMAAVLAGFYAFVRWRGGHA